MSVFDAVRAQVALDQLVSANGSGKARCVAPGHRDESPSMHLYEDHAHCFSCGLHGDVTDLWAAMHGFSRPLEAALDLAREFGIELPEISAEARQKAQEQREKEDLYLEQARACYRALERHPRVRDWWECRGFAEELRERFLLGANRDGTAAVIPFWFRGRIKGMIVRKLEGEPKYLLPKADEFVDGHRPLFVPGALRGGEVYLVEGYVDALALADAGRSAVAVGGTDASENQVAELRKFGKVWILPDADSSGEEASSKWAKALYPAARICQADYGPDSEDDDVAAYFARYGPEETAEHVGRLVEGSIDILDVEMAKAKGIRDRRERLAYMSKNIAPLLVPLHPESLQDATADIVSETVKLKKSWITKAIKDEQRRRAQEKMSAAHRRTAAEEERREEEYRRLVAEAQPRIDELLAPGVLRRLRNTAATIHNVYGDREPLELALLVALGAQLAPLPNGRPLGASVLLTAPPSRGKNHIFDAAVKLLPEDFYFIFEKASGQSFNSRPTRIPRFSCTASAIRTR